MRLDDFSISIPLLHVVPRYPTSTDSHSTHHATVLLSNHLRRCPQENHLKRVPASL